VRVYTAHLRQRSAPVLVREGFSWGALLFGPSWLAAQRAWIAAVLLLVAELAVALLLPGPAGRAAQAGIALLTGLCGHDLVRWSLDLRGYTLVHVVAGRDSDAAFLRLLQTRPELAPLAAGPL
jgi:hypothetical protein